MYAVIEDSGTQFRVKEGDVIKIDARELPEESLSVTFDRVLYVGSEEGDDAPTIGAPLVEGATVEAEILEEGRDDKIDIIKFRRRKSYRRKRGHRQPFVKVQIASIKA